MAVTYLQLKNRVANRSGRTDGGTANTIRDNAINDVIRDTIANYYPFSWLKRDTTIALDSSGDGDLPADFNPSHRLQPGMVRVAGAGVGDDNYFTEIAQERFDSYDSTNSYAYYIDYNTSTDRYRLRTSEPSVTATVTYFHIPAALSADADVCIVPDPEVPTLLASARVWLAKERDETNHDRDLSLGLKKLDQLIIVDKRSKPQRLHRSSLYTRDLGFNSVS